MKKVLVVWAALAVVMLFGSGCTLTGDVVHGDKTSVEKQAESVVVQNSNAINAYREEAGGAKADEVAKASELGAVDAEGIDGDGDIATVAKQVIASAGASSINQEQLAETKTDTVSSAGGKQNTQAVKDSDASPNNKDSLELSPDVKVSPTGL
jgi:hypothetical protein